MRTSPTHYFIAFALLANLLFLQKPRFRHADILISCTRRKQSKIFLLSVAVQCTGSLHCSVAASHLKLLGLDFLFHEAVSGEEAVG